MNYQNKEWLYNKYWNEEFKTLNLSSGMYGLDLKLVIVPVEIRNKLIVPKQPLIKVVK